MSLYVLLMGVQGSGKGTQAGFLQQDYHIPHVSTGDLFRAMKTRTDALAVSIQETMASGRLVSDEQTNAVVQDRFEQPDAENGALLDGYPRTVPQAQWLEDYLARKHARLNAVILLQLDLYTAFKRAFGRVGAHGEYNIYYNNEGLAWQFVEHPEKAFPPRLEAHMADSGTPLLRRPDDANPDSIIKRIDTYLATTRTLIDYYDRQKIVHEVNADRSIEAVRAEIKAIVERSR